MIAAVEGYAFAGGTEVLQGTDIRVASTAARFAVSEAKRSLYPMGRLSWDACAGRSPACGWSTSL